MIREHGIPSVVRGLLLAFAVATLGVLLLAGPASAAGRWSDISDEQWEGAYGVTAAQVATVASGFTDGTFQPTRIVTRGQFAALIAAAFHMDLASASRIVSEYFGGVPQPSQSVARREAHAILGSLLSTVEVQLTGHIAGVSGSYDSLEDWYATEGADLLTLFADRAGLTPSDAPETAYLVLRGVVRGSSRQGALYLEPMAQLTRAQAVTLILRAAAAEPGKARSLEPFVSTGWLAAHLDDEDVVVLDLRSAADYAAGHIPGAISVPFSTDSAWSRSGELTLEVPGDAELFKVIGDCGIGKASSVVLVGGIAQATTYPLIDTVRVAATLVHAGIHNVGILQGGYARWSTERRASTIDVPSVQPVTYGGPSDEDVFVGTEYVKSRLGKAVLIDTRAPDVYFGVTLDVAGKPGHIPTARSLPAQWLWQATGEYVSAEHAQRLAIGVVGTDKDAEIIVYCAVGGTASTWWYMLSQVLGYRDVKLYDGSAQAWAEDNDLSAYTWFY